MKTITVKGFIQAKLADQYLDHQNVIDGFELTFWRLKDMKEQGYSLVGPVSFEYTLPETFDPRGGQVNILKAQKRELMAQFQARCTEIERKISELTALTFEAAV